MSTTQKCCTTCRNYSVLVKPRERSDGAKIYGYCFKDGDRDYNTNMGKGLPVWIDGAGCCCKNYHRKEATP